MYYLLLLKTNSDVKPSFTVSALCKSIFTRISNRVFLNSDYRDQLNAAARLGKYDCLRNVD